ncbi:hypothetical protein [Phenylobacterium sp.]|uniref:hypothetical protein n=1 Tax=Phenylobacterium sp. TaxID=1871053 RepID=UPI0025CD84E3|nr:hypothetical protein [Phenylobacterium sp.]
MNSDTIVINGETYAKVKANPGKRAVVVVDRGWVFAGDVSEDDGRIRLTRVVWVFRWESIGFDGVLKDPKSSKVMLRKLDTGVDLPADAEVFRCPVADDWGM